MPSKQQITLAELDDFAGRLELSYRRDTNLHPPYQRISVHHHLIIEGHIDQSGWDHWRADYEAKRYRHDWTHENAARWSEYAIDVIEGYDPPRWFDQFNPPPLPDPDPVPDPDPAPPVVTPGIQGTLRLAAGQAAYVDDTGPVLPVFCHLGDAFSRFTRNPSPVLYLLDDIAEAGYHGVRFWTYLTGPYWAGREVDAGRQPELLAAFGQALLERGLQAVVSQGDLWQADLGTLQRVKDAIRQAFPHEAIAFCDAGNEVPNNGGASPTDCAAWISGLPGVLSLSTTQSEEQADLIRWSRSPAQIFDEHGYRGGHWWDKTRHMFNLAYEGAPDDRRLGIQSEPFGFGQRVSSTQNIHELTDDVMAFAAVVSLLARQAYVWFSGPGVISDESERLQDMPGFASVPRLAAQLPRDVMTYARLVHGGASQGGARVFGVTDEHGAGTTRCDQAVDPASGRFVAAIYGPNPQYRALQDYDADVDVSLQNGQMRLIVGRVK